MSAADHDIKFYGRLDKRFASDRMLKFFIWIPSTWPFILPLLVYVKTYQDGSLAYYCVLAVFILLWVGECGICWLMTKLNAASLDFRFHNW